jgi:hypothetical protein
MNRLGAHHDLFVERNDFVFALLGVWSYGRHVRGFILRNLAFDGRTHADPVAAERMRRVPKAAFAVLGVVSLAAQLDGLIQAWASESKEPSRGRSEPVNQATPRSLAR